MSREGFTFYLSYARIAAKLSNKERLAFYDALIKKEFTGEDPVDLPTMAAFAYESQRHSIEKQVIGYERAKNVVLSEIKAPLGLPLGSPPKEVQEQGEEQVQGKSKIDLPFSSSKFITAWNEWLAYRRESGYKTANKTISKQLKFLSEQTEDNAIKIIDASISSGWMGLFPLKENTVKVEKNRYKIQ